MKGNRIVRNAIALLVGQPVTWALTLAFTVLVPRNVGPDEWGEWVIAMGVGQVATLLFDIGTSTVILKGVSRYPEDSSEAMGIALTVRTLLAPLLVLAIVGFSFVAHYSAHTRLIVAVVAVSVAASYVAAPAVAGLRAFEKMHLSTIVTVLSTVILTGGAIVMVKFFALGVISIAILSVVAQTLGLALQVYWFHKLVPIRLRINHSLVAQLFTEGLPYWITSGFFTMYVWLDGVMLSLMASPHENGWYGVCLQLISVPGFLISAVTTAVFPTLARGVADGGEMSAEVVARSFRLLVVLSLPMAAGMSLISTNLIAVLYGGWFAPAAGAISILALTIPSVYVATLVSTCLVAADRQIQWTWVMASVLGLNLVLNLFAIPFFHTHYGNGAMGAALSLLISDFATGVLGLALLPRSLRPAVRGTIPAILAALAATLVMSAVVWPLRDLWLPIPILAGAAVFILVALPLRAFPRDEIQLILGTATRFLPRTRPAGVATPVPSTVVVSAVTPSLADLPDERIA
jgi:O-antigen/teichoic acid export membrane protein